MADVTPSSENNAPAAADEEEYFDDSSEEEWANAPGREGGDVKPRSPPPTDRIHDEDETERELAGEAVPITFTMPDGTAVQRSYRMGHTIALIKAHLEDYHGLPYDRTVLTLKDMVCIDPLSLNDLPFVANEENIVVVTLN